MMNLSKKKGFTLVELLVVIGIIGILSTLAVGGYIQYRKATLLDFSADTIISQLREMQANAGHGVVGRDSNEDTGSFCYGMDFVRDGDYFVAKTFKQNFNAKKIWKGEIVGWDYEGCTGAMNYSDVTVDSQVYMTELTDQSGRALVPDFFVQFLPPYGDSASSDQEVEKFSLKMQYGLDAQGGTRTINYELKTGHADVQKD